MEYAVWFIIGFVTGITILIMGAGEIPDKWSGVVYSGINGRFYRIAIIRNIIGKIGVLVWDIAVKDAIKLK